MKSHLKIKLCGLREEVNIKALIALPLDYMGFIFYSKSPRFVGQKFERSILSNIPSKIKKVGVFVNENLERVLDTAETFQLNAIQLHGNENPEDCRLLKNMGFEVIKAFQINEASQFERLNKYQKFCDFFLFDTKSDGFGGSGKKFNWEILREYKGETPFFLSGGIGPEDARLVNEFHHLNFYGLDLNSGFEDCPAFKNVLLVNEFLKSVR